MRWDDRLDTIREQVRSACHELAYDQAVRLLDAVASEVERQRDILDGQDDASEDVTLLDDDEGGDWDGDDED